MSSSLSDGGATRPAPHVLMFPLPGQGHINPMMQLARRLMEEGGFFITFVNTDHTHQLMFGTLQAGPLVDAALPRLRFEHIPDGMPEWHKRFNERPNGVVETIAATLALPGPLTQLVRRIVDSEGDGWPPLTCIVADSFFSWVQEVANIFGVPRVSLWTTPVHANLAYTFQERVQSRGLIPVTDKSKLQDILDCVDGIVPLKFEDYISFFLIDSTNDFLFQWLLRLCMKRPQEAAWNLGNNFQELEDEAISAFTKEVPNFLPIGPLLPIDVLRGKAHDAASDRSIISLWPSEDATCNDWLSQHEKASVIYVSFGSVASMTEDELAELIQALEDIGAPFLWAVRADQGGAALSQLREKLGEESAQGRPSRRALLVSWAPQLAVLMHPSVGLFLSHCGWNSVMESVAAAVPILAKPTGFAEQRMNAHYIEQVWKIGHRLPSGASANTMKALVSSLMGSSPEAARMQGQLAALRQTALGALSSPGGSSVSNLQLFIDDMYRRAAAASK